MTFSAKITYFAIGICLIHSGLHSMDFESLVEQMQNLGISKQSQANAENIDPNIAAQAISLTRGHFHNFQANGELREILGDAILAKYPNTTRNKDLIKLRARKVRIEQVNDIHQLMTVTLKNEKLQKAIIEARRSEIERLARESAMKAMQDENIELTNGVKDRLRKFNIPPTEKNIQNHLALVQTRLVQEIATPLVDQYITQPLKALDALLLRK